MNPGRIYCQTRGQRINLEMGLSAASGTCHIIDENLGKEVIEMAKWADYVVTGASYDRDHKHIVAVKGYADTENNLGPAFQHTRAQVVSNIKNNISYCTARIVEGKYNRGQNVVTITIGVHEFIKTERNNLEEDNLGELPEF